VTPAVAVAEWMDTQEIEINAARAMSGCTQRSKPRCMRLAQ